VGIAHSSQELVRLRVMVRHFVLEPRVEEPSRREHGHFDLGSSLRVDLATTGLRERIG
jgi:hypothetical protein